MRDTVQGVLGKEEKHFSGKTHRQKTLETMSKSPRTPPTVQTVRLRDREEALRARRDGHSAFYFRPIWDLNGNYMGDGNMDIGGEHTEVAGVMELMARFWLFWFLQAVAVCLFVFYQFGQYFWVVVAVYCGLCLELFVASICYGGWKNIQNVLLQCLSPHKRAYFAFTGKKGVFTTCSCPKCAHGIPGCQTSARTPVRAPTRTAKEGGGGATTAPAPAGSASAPEPATGLRQRPATAERPATGINATNSRGWTALMEAVHLNNDASVDSLLEGKADPSASGCSGITPLMIAVEDKRPFMVRTLIKAKACLLYTSPSPRDRG